ncbi:hypothetical protein [Heyndrickxia ginsengihumi]|uniref:hypothetical protein n=1 Tax=Heyndrickxia ginsengihumi TaxID=363870 RepID=UPI000AD4E7AF|nr:hypothetical protein [Heyndrickxia ginsengihumi]
MTRRVIEHKAFSHDREELLVVTVFEEGVSKQEVRKENPYTKRHGVLVRFGDKYDWR